MSNKERYEQFCASTYTPIYSKPWWMDAVCGPENWDVWLYESGGTVLAAMPYYMEQRGPYRYITKAPLTQNNGIIFKEEPNQKLVTKMEMQERIINAACAFIQSLGLDVYEQQYSPSFQNWLPFFWNNYTAITRYTYVIENTSDLDYVMQNIEKSRRNRIRKGLQKTELHEDMDSHTFYSYNQKIYEKQGLSAPFSEVLWENVYSAVQAHKCGKTLFRTDSMGNVACISFVAWDDRYLYKLIGGPMPELSHLEAHSAMTWNQIELANSLHLQFDFEGSVIKRISKSFREYGGRPMPYFRIRKVFNPEIVRKEAEDYIKRLQSEDAEHKFC